MNDRLKYVRKLLKLSPKFVAQQLSIPLKTLEDIEDGTRKITPKELTMLSDLYGIDVDKLVSGEFYDKHSNTTNILIKFKNTYNIKDVIQ